MTITAIAIPSSIGIKHVIPVGRQPMGMAVNPAANMAYVTNYGDNIASVISGRTKKVVTTIVVDVGPAAVATNPLTNTVYVAISVGNTVPVITGDQHSVVAPATASASRRQPVSIRAHDSFARTR